MPTLRRGFHSGTAQVSLTWNKMSKFPKSETLRNSSGWLPNMTMTTTRPGQGKMIPLPFQFKANMVPARLTEPTSRMPNPWKRNAKRFTSDGPTSSKPSPARKRKRPRMMIPTPIQMMTVGNWTWKPKMVVIRMIQTTTAILILMIRILIQAVTLTMIRIPTPIQMMSRPKRNHPRLRTSPTRNALIPARCHGLHHSRKFGRLTKEKRSQTGQESTRASSTREKGGQIFHTDADGELTPKQMGNHCRQIRSGKVTALVKISSQSD